MAPPARNPRREFELVEVLDQTSSLTDVVRSEGLRGLHVGSGARQLRAGWLNTDQVELADLQANTTQPGRIARLNGDIYYLQHDASQPFPLEDESFEWIYSEHFIEHLTPEEGIEWLKEVRRLLKPGGFTRISTPNLSRYATGYLDREQKFFKEHFEKLQRLPNHPSNDRPAWLVNQIFYKWGHKWIYDFEELRHAAACAGFDPDAATECGFHEGLVPEVSEMDLERRNDESLYVEIRRT